MRAYHRYFVCCVVIVLAMSATQAGNTASDFPDLVDWMTTESSKLKPVLPPVPVVTPKQASVVYSLQEQLDPFDRVKIGESVHVDVSGQNSRSVFFPLEETPIESVVLVGVINNAKEKKALIKISNNGNKVYALKEGDRVGIDGEKVFEIKKNYIVVRGLGVDSKGRKELVIDKQITIVGQEAKK